MRRRALFLDRDGVINLDHGFVHRREDFDFVDGIFDLAAEATRRGLPLVVVTNQSGIGRGRYTEADFQALMGWVAAEFAARGTPLARVEHCPDHPDRPTPRRKPAPGMLLDAAAALGLDLPGSIMVGDQPGDAEAARRAGLGTRILVSADAAAAGGPEPGAETLRLPSVRDVARWLARRP